MINNTINTIKENSYVFPNLHFLSNKNIIYLILVAKIHHYISLFAKFQHHLRKISSIAMVRDDHADL